MEEEEMNILFKNGKARRPLLILFDILCLLLMNVAYYYSTKLFENTPGYPDDIYLYNTIILISAMMISRFIFRVYSNIWRYTSTKAYFYLVLADFCGGIAALIISRSLFIFFGIWHFVNIASLSALLAVTSRFVYRLLYKRHNVADPEEGPNINVAIVGAGQLGVLLASDLTNNRRSIYTPVFFIDKNEAKVGSRLYSLPVYYECAGVLEQIKRAGVSEIFIAIANLSSEEAERLYNFYSLTGCKIKIYDIPVRDAAKNGNAKPMIREFEIEDLLFREPANVANNEDLKYYNEKTVLVTGGGGSIGSELCRQIAKCNPKKLIIFDIYENNAYDIQQELVRTYGEKLDLAVEIGSVRDRQRLESVFVNYKPDVVFHAAAHKHVPLMEQSGCEAIKNNVFGTYNTADMAEKHGAERFILISTDKAVNPTNIMGASKRMCEMVVQCRADSKTSFAAVRFGNVLGSNGSVIPLFKRQIAAGGPVTITDKRIIRYFMTIPEASQLVMEAGAMAKRGELFVLDMGKPVKIYDLAKNMIRLSGFEPETDIKIEEIGLRPGEKLYEELLMQSDSLDRTDNRMIFIEREEALSREEVEQKLSILASVVERAGGAVGSAAIKEALYKVIPTFHEPGEVNKKAASSREMQAVE
ncbi:MAG: polysaccharide biosynthesis protein [Ruminococcaceae bacterium]|nr:polysaccharide biosynthesis protein [Oscillospiraceae bacterium]